MTNGKASAVVIREIGTGEEVRSIDTTDQSDRGHDKVVMGVMRQTNLDRFWIDEQGEHE